MSAGNVLFSWKQWTCLKSTLTNGSQGMEDIAQIIVAVGDIDSCIAMGQIPCACKEET